MEIAGARQERGGGEEEGSLSVRARGRVGVAHSFKGEEFGPAQALHGITYVVDAQLTRPRAAPPLLWRGGLEGALHEALGAYDRRNLDEMSEFEGENTTCERFALAVWTRMAAALSPVVAPSASLRIGVKESDIASVAYERSLEEGGGGGGGAGAGGVYSVSVRSRFMAARSLRGDRYGPSQQLHGATFVVDAVLSGRQLIQGKGFLVDICLAEQLLADAVAPLHQTNLDSSLGGVNPTAHAIAEAIGGTIAAGVAKEPLESLRLVIREDDQASPHDIP
ncbi:MAG: hypothetical protein SGPRY_003217 [Prymnesium sp.]